MKAKLYYFIIFIFLICNQTIYAQDVELSNKLINQLQQTKTQTGKQVKNKAITSSCISSIILEAKKNWSKLTPKAQGIFKIYTTRPVLSKTFNTTNYSFHYDVAGTDAVPTTDADASGTPDYVEQMAAVFEHVWLEYKNRNYTMPPLDGTRGGSTKYDIYISDLGSSLYGFVSPDVAIGNNPQSTTITEVDAYSSWMGMNKDYSWVAPTPELDAIKVTAAHEFFHAVQFGTVSHTTNFIAEATAAWSEDEVYPGIDDNLQYLPPMFSQPDVALNWNSDDGALYDSRWYGGWLFFRYLTEKTSSDLIRKIYKETITENDEIFAIETVLNSDYSSDFETMYKKYLISLDVLTDVVSLAPYTYSRAATYKSSLAKYQSCGSVCYENGFNFTGTTLLHSSNTTVIANTTLGNGTLMRFGADYFDLTTNQNFKIKCAIGASSPVSMLLLKYNSTQSTVAVSEAVVVNGVLEISVSDYQNYDAYTLIVFRADNVADTNSEQYELNISKYTALGLENFANSAVVAYPNPVKDDLSINNLETLFTNYELINTAGQVIKKANTATIAQNNKIDIRQLSDGIYYLKLTTKEGKTAVRKIIVKK
ncbi:T9SS type A sorting domain-containing protein [Flavobacterium restrictum]|uniref:T9SS type A sorting domain-containing protein n=1 Tax=Flavobacterium restrictum TaxID=2594428 RepID=A0A553EBA3_9FLAO|nr:T9SS type A sorting domain-containing protein [Flavobacterium restrictum]TRX42344.1 T9SS type A sorting domain-containing protein [Flavobacterium restrictum]